MSTLTEPAPVAEWLSTVVLVRQGSATCAGARVGSDRVLTAYHCLASGGRPAVVDQDGQRAVARVVWVDRAADLALLSSVGTSWAPIASEAPSPGEAVWALGHPGGAELPGGFYAGTLRWSASLGVVAAVGEAALQVTNPLEPGSSGGPLVNVDGEVVAVASRRLAGQGLGFAARADGLRIDGERPLGPLGGVWGGELFLASQDGPTGGTLALGARAGLAVRDRVVVDGALIAPLSGAMAAARFGDAISGLAEARVGLRQRFGRGPWAARVDGFAGAVALRTITRPDPALPLELDTVVAPASIVGGGLRVHGVGFELAWMPDQELVRSSAIVRWPGDLGVF